MYALYDDTQKVYCFPFYYLLRKQEQKNMIESRDGVKNKKWEGEWEWKFCELTYTVACKTGFPCPEWQDRRSR
jgi:hypothetical protein